MCKTMMQPSLIVTGRQSDDKMISDEISESDNQVTRHLRYLYDTKSDDRQSLAHIRERLQKNSQEALPAIDSLKNITELPHERLTPPTRLHPTRPTERNRTVWSQRLLQLIAILLIAAITGVFAIVLTLSHTTSGDNIALRPGWQQVAVYSGKGNTTLTGLKQPLPQLWASSITCKGDGAVNITMSGISAEDLKGTDSCQSPLLTSSQPNTFSYNESSTVVIQTIKVTANANTSWQFRLLQAIKQPTFHLASEWKSSGGSASDNGITFTRNSPDDQWRSLLTAPKGVTMQAAVGYGTTSAQTWAIVTICFGNGKSHIQLSPNVGNIPMPTCNGQPVLTVLRFPTVTEVDTMTVFAEGDIVWNASIVSCTDEARCQRLPALHVTPNFSTLKRVEKE